MECYATVDVQAFLVGTNNNSLGITVRVDFADGVHH